MTISCCYKCTEKWVKEDGTNCHFTCERYIEEKRFNDEKKEFIRRSKAEMNALNNDKINGIKRMKKNRR